MIERVKAWWAKPLAEDFSLRNQAWQSVQAGLYLFLFLTCFTTFDTGGRPRLLVYTFFSVACAAASLLANGLLPRLFPGWYNEDRWTFGRHAGHVLVILLAVATANQLLLFLLKMPRPPFLTMYLTVTVIGFFPVIMGVMLAERRRLTRNLARAQQLNTQLDSLHRPANVPDPAAPAELPKPILLVSETGRERLNLLPNQFIFAESVGNYVEVHWLNFMFPQKTVLRSTLREVEAALAGQPQFFRCHRAFLVNLRAVSRSTGNARGYHLTLSGSNREIPVSRGYIAPFDRQLKSLV